MDCTVRGINLAERSQNYTMMDRTLRGISLAGTIPIVCYFPTDQLGSEYDMNQMMVNEFKCKERNEYNVHGSKHMHISGLSILSFHLLFDSTEILMYDVVL